MTCWTEDCREADRRRCRGAYTLVAALIFLLLGSERALSAEVVDSGPVLEANAFFSRLNQGKIDDAYEGLAARSPALRAKEKGLEIIKEKTREAHARYGRPLGFQLIESKEFGRYLVRLTYVQALDLHPIVWTLWFYHPKDVWHVDNVTFDDSLHSWGGGN